jgi:putative transposase
MTSCPGHRFPADIIHRAVWLYLRFALSYRDVEELLAERGIDVSYETIRRWVVTFGPDRNVDRPYYTSVLSPSKP